MLAVMAVALVAIAAKLVDLQGVNGPRFARLAYDQRVHTVVQSAERGSIFDADGRDLALSVPQDSVVADPTQVKDPADAAARLAPVLGIAASTLESAMRTPDTRFVYLDRLVRDRVSARVRALRLRGIELVPESKRFYPAQDLAGPVLGIVDRGGTGAAGLEAQYNRLLSGRSGEAVVQLDPRGREIPATTRQLRDARRGSDLVLTIDESLQYEAEQSLAAQVAAVNAKGGMAIIMDTRTGDIRAMATVDGATGTTPAHPAGALEANAPVTTIYEPGSTNKVITIATAIEAGLISPDTVLTVPQSITVGGTQYADVEEHGITRMSVADILRESSNVGTIEIAKLLGKQRLDGAVRHFRLGALTALRFPGESPGILLPLSQYNATSMGSIPVGSGIAVTALQMLGSYATIANGGVTVPPRLVASTIDANGTRHDTPIAKGKRVVSARTAQEVTTMLEGVVESGTGTAAAIPGYPVAGKTGTARKAPYPHPPYNYVASFAGFAPADNPHLAAIVVMDEPQGLIYGGEVAAPVFATIIQNALREQRVAPTSGLDAPLPTGGGEPVSNDAPTLAPSPAAIQAPPGSAGGSAAQALPGSAGTGTASGAPAKPTTAPSSRTASSGARGSPASSSRPSILSGSSSPSG